MRSGNRSGAAEAESASNAAPATAAQTRAVQEPKGKPLRERPCQADSLLLATGDGVGAWTDGRFVALRPADHVIVYARQPGCVLDRFVVDVAEEADVVGDRGMQQARFLGHVSDRLVPALS